MFQISRVDHTALRTDDMEATVQFYCGVLGLPLLQTMRGSGASRRYVFSAGDRNRLVFFDGHARSEEGPHSTWTTSRYTWTPWRNLTKRIAA